jgi:FkbM family methyltransferase
LGISDPGLLSSSVTSELQLKFATAKAMLRTARALGLKQAFQVYSHGQPGKETLLKYSDGKALRLRKGTSDVDTLYQIGVRKEIRMPLRFAAPRIIDAGANIGLSIREFLQQYPRATVAGIEPAGDNFAILERNVEEFSGVRLFKAGLWYRSERLHIENPDAQPWGYRMTTENAVGTEVPGMTVDQVLNHMGWDRCDILKLDIEGAEREVLNHSEAWLNRVDCILVETHDRYRVGCTDAVERVAKQFPYRLELGEKHLLSRNPLATGNEKARSVVA